MSPLLDPTILVPIATGLLGIAGLFLKVYLKLLRRQEAREDVVAERDKHHLNTMDSIKNTLDAQRNAFIRLEEEQRQGFRTLQTEIREAGVAAREATRELIAEIRSAFRFGSRPGGPQ